jgi:hypothetical protein
LSTDLLFEPNVEGRLHFDPDAGNSFGRSVPYANYNWELFLHTPLAIADYLASQQRFNDARRWLHAVFDPTRPLTASVHDFWRFLPFHNGTTPDTISAMLAWLANPDPDPADTPAEQYRKARVEDDVTSQIAQWKKNPFMPHLVARLRPSAYQWHTFFAYLDVLIRWGDQLFRRDTRDSINQATLLYVLAAKLLGPRPRVIPAQAPPPPQTYRSLQAATLDAFGNEWITYTELPGIRKLSSSLYPGDAALRAAQSQAATASAGGGAVTAGSSSGGKTAGPIVTLRTTADVVGPAAAQPSIRGLASLSSPLFCIPQNDKLTEFYTRLDDRLSNVRNCRNIDGVTRTLPLFEPPIDPLLLIRARAAGIDIGGAVAGLYAPLPHYRFAFTLQKALDLTGEVKALGSALLAALEKEDGEDLALLRSGHEIAMLDLVTDTRKQQRAEAEANITALQQSEVTVRERFDQYQRLLGKSSATNGQDGVPVVEQASSLSVATDEAGGVSGMGLTRKEVAQLLLSADSHARTQAVNAGYVLAGVLSIFPNVWAGAVTAGQTFGGANLANAGSAMAKALEMGAAESAFLASQIGTLGGYERRQDEWVHQSKLALAELKQIKKQVIAAEIRLAMADLELRNHETQIENAKSVDEFMRDKFTSKQLHRWMSSQIAEVYFRTYQLALDQAKRAERAYQHELGLDAATTPFVRVSYWDSLKKGLLAGEQLHHDLKRMDAAFLEQNRREYEISKHVSLSQLDPVALILLKQTGKCTVSLPEALFDLDYPGHYLRRLKSVGLSIPCVVGPYANVSCTLTLKRSSVRCKTVPGTDYAGDPYNGDDSRFRIIAGPTESIVTSSAQNDSGLFETSLRDERYLPFEGAGAISEWDIELTNGFRAFDFGTIADVVLHIRYTSRDASSTLKAPAVQHLQGVLNAIVDSQKETGLARVFSLRHEFSTEWYRVLHPSPAGADGAVTLRLTKDRLPFLFQGSSVKFTAFALLVRVNPRFAATHNVETVKLSLVPQLLPAPVPAPALAPLSLTSWPASGDTLLRADIVMSDPVEPGSWMLSAWLEKSLPVVRSSLDPHAIEDIFLVARYNV